MPLWILLKYPTSLLTLLLSERGLMEAQEIINAIVESRLFFYRSKFSTNLKITNYDVYILRNCYISVLTQQADKCIPIKQQFVIYRCNAYCY